MLAPLAHAREAADKAVAEAAQEKLNQAPPEMAPIGSHRAHMEPSVLEAIRRDPTHVSFTTPAFRRITFTNYLGDAFLA